MIYAIYRLVNKNNGKFYIGCTGIPLRERFYNHIYASRYGYKYTKQYDKDDERYRMRVQQVIREEGYENFDIFEIEGTNNPERAASIEIWYINKLQPEYNMSHTNLYTPWAKSSNKEDKYCIHCKKKVSEYILNEYHGDNCISKGSGFMSSKCTRCEEEKPNYSFGLTFGLRRYRVCMECRKTEIKNKPKSIAKIYEWVA